MNISSQPKPIYWAVVPAAGVGARMGSLVPKQYLPIHGKTVIEHSIHKLLAITDLQRIYVALSEDDCYWPELAIANYPTICRVNGATERAGSVLNALLAISTHASDSDWVLVHDAARPCVEVTDIEALIASVGNHDIGGILGVPVSDTLKRVHDREVIFGTVDRTQLWQAQTPQLFRLGLLRTCLQRALAEAQTITDEASALEAYGYQPLIVKGCNSNLKITYPEDVMMASLLLQQQTNS